MFGRTHIRSPSTPERSYLCRHCGRITWASRVPDPLCACCLRAGGMSIAPPGTLDHRLSRPHRNHDHLWPDPVAAVPVRPRRGWVFVCQTCGDVSLASKSAHCLGRNRATIRRVRLLLHLGEDGRLGYSAGAGNVPRSRGVAAA